MCKIEKKNAKWTGAVIYVGHFIVLLSSGAPCICVCYSALRERGACPLQGYWLLSVFIWPILTSIFFVRGNGRNWTAGLVTTGCLAVRLRCQEWKPAIQNYEILDSTTRNYDIGVAKNMTELSMQHPICIFSFTYRQQNWNFQYTYSRNMQN